MFIDLNIRKAIPDDIASIIDLERASATAAHWKEAQYQHLFIPREPGLQALVLVAEAPDPASAAESTSLLGFLVARHVGAEWELENIVVATSAQRHGFGTLLLQALLDEARQTHNAAVFLEVRESNTAAHALYEKSGFAQIGRRIAYYAGPQEDAISYRWTAS